MYLFSKSTNSLLCKDGKCKNVGDVTGNIPNIKIIRFNGGCGCGYGNFGQGIILDQVMIFSQSLTPDQIYWIEMI